MLSGVLDKMEANLTDDLVHYKITLGGKSCNLNHQLGKKIALRFEGGLICWGCGEETGKVYGDGYCGKCFKTLARCDLCIVKPELCHYDDGTCREPEWGEKNCMIPHFVYLSNTSGVKVGITRHTQVPTRWIDQGAIQALPIFKVASRYQSGVFEQCLRELVSDKTNWRKMLKGEVEAADLPALRDQLFASLGEDLDQLEERFGLESVECLEDEEVVEINYPVEEYPSKVKSLNFDKTPLIEGTLRGIKGQYLILDIGVLNIRRASGRVVTLDIGS